MEEKFTLVDNFIAELVQEDLDAGKVKDNVVCTRVPPEPNGYLHLGHVKSTCINFGIARRFGGKCFLYFDDTNPQKEKDEYVQSIKNDIKWLGFEWDKEYFASDHYEDLFNIAVELIKQGKAYVCHLTPEEMREYRGTLTEPGKESPYRDRPIEESLDLFYRMRNAEFKEGECTLRAKIDMSSPILCMRDPVIYRIMYVTHHRTGDKWCIYPMYDFASPLLDTIEGVTHSLCGPEFEERRPLYNWSTGEVGWFANPSRQIEFAKINVHNVILGKRYLKRLVEEGFVSGWDDPRMPTIAGMRRRGYPAQALKDFINVTGVAKSLSETDYAVLEHCVREVLKPTSPTRMAVVNPIKLVIDNYDGEEMVSIPNGVSEDMGEREVPFGKELYIESADFMAEPAHKYFRLYPGNEVRLKGAYIVKCVGYEETPEGLVVHCTYDPDTKSGECTRKVKATIHWVNAKHAIPAEFRLYDMMLTDDMPSADEGINPNSLVVSNGYVEQDLTNANIGDRYQFIRNGYFVLDRDSTDDRMVYNRIVGLKDSFKK